VVLVFSSLAKTWITMEKGGIITTSTPKKMVSITKTQKNEN